MIDLQTIITDVELLASRTVFRCGFSFTSLANIGNKANIYDAIIVRSPADALCFSPKLGCSTKTLQEHIDFINEHQLEKAVVIANDISFLLECPSLRYLQIIPTDDSDDFDYSPLYQLDNIAGLNCTTEYGLHFKKTTQIDYSHFRNIIDLDLVGRGHVNTEHLATVQRLNVFKSPAKHLHQITTSPVLNNLSLTQSRIQSLDDLTLFGSISDISLWYNRSLFDVSTLRSHAKSIKMLSIGSCPKIEDFSFLEDLYNLEYLELMGNNSLPNLKFLSSLKALRCFTFDMNVLDGDLTQCLNIPCVHLLRNRKHYNLSDTNLPK